MRQAQIPGQSGIAVILLFAGIAPAAPPLEIAWTYQGELKQGGSPINEACDFMFGPWCKAVVGLPPYSAKIIKDQRYALAAIGAPMPKPHATEEAALATEAQAGPGVAVPASVFRIAGGAPGGKVSWRIDAVRNDLRARSRPMDVETEKQNPERGKYQHPGLYGKPPGRGMDYRLPTQDEYQVRSVR